MAFHGLLDPGEGPGSLGEGSGSLGEGSGSSGVVCRKRPFAGKKSFWVAAADIGTTTIAMALYDGEGGERDRFMTVNPQVRYGADVLSRIQAASDPAVAIALQEDVLAVLKEGMHRFSETFQQAREMTDGIRLAIVGNTSMLYLLRGLDPRELGEAPFQASHLEGVYRRRTEESGFGLEWVSLLPGLSAFVGADILAGICACRMAEREELTLLVDLGTNGEMVLGNHDRLLACATAAGPAFEGGATRGIWGADMVHLTAALLREGVLDETGLLADPYFEEGIRIGNVRLKQAHIRQLQVAKAAIGAGIGALLREYGLKDPEQIDRVVLAGGFGYFLQAEDAARIGLLPRGLSAKTEPGGNAALAGALRYGYCPEEMEKELNGIRKRTQVMNLAENPYFKEHYIEAMNLAEWA